MTSDQTTNDDSNRDLREIVDDLTETINSLAKNAGGKIPAFECMTETQREEFERLFKKADSLLVEFEASLEESAPDIKSLEEFLKKESKTKTDPRAAFALGMGLASVFFCAATGNLPGAAAGLGLIMLGGLIVASNRSDTKIKETSLLTAQNASLSLLNAGLMISAANPITATVYGTIALVMGLITGDTILDLTKLLKIDSSLREIKDTIEIYRQLLQISKEDLGTLRSQFEAAKATAKKPVNDNLENVTSQTPVSNVNDNPGNVAFRNHVSNRNPAPGNEP